MAQNDLAEVAEFNLPHGRRLLKTYMLRNPESMQSIHQRVGGWMPLGAAGNRDRKSDCRGGTVQEPVSAEDSGTFAKTGSRQENTMAENETGSGGLGWFLAGLGIGALVGVLYAPKSGRETREDLANSAAEAQRRAAELMEQGRQRANEYAEQGRQMMEQGRQKAAELVEQGRQTAQDSIDKGREYYEKGRTQWSQYVEKGKNIVNEQQTKIGAAVDAGKEAYQGNPSGRSTGTEG